MQTIQSSDAPIELRVAGTEEYKTLVCTSDYNIPLNTTVNTVDTFCGRAVGLGVIEFNPAGSAVCEQQPTSDQVTYNDLVSWQLAKTILEFRVQFPGTGSVGGIIYLTGECSVTATELQGAVNEVLKFTYTLTGQGTPTNVPA